MKVLVLLSLLSFSLVAQESLPESQWKFVSRYCTDCHDEDMYEGNLNLDFKEVNWQDADIRKHWGDVHKMMKRGKMPPKRKKKQPTTAEKASFMSWLDKKLTQVNPIGGTTIRRLNKREYLSTISDLFDMKDFTLPGSFPQDLSSHGFDTLAKDLVISPSHFEAYNEAAIKVADYLFPPKKKAVKIQSWDIPASDMTISYSSSYLVDGAMRLASQGIKSRNGTWPAKFEAPVSGTYKVKITLSTKNPPPGLTPIASMKAQKPNNNGERALKDFYIKKGKPQEFTETVNLYRGENLLFFFSNAPYSYGNKEKFQSFLEDLFLKNPRLTAAWASLKDIPRGGVGWNRVKDAMNNKSLNVEKYRNNKKESQKLAKRAVGKNAVSSGETLVYKFFEEGPNIGIHSIEIVGPIKEIIDLEIRTREKTQKRFLQGREISQINDLETLIEGYLKAAFRRKPSTLEIQKYVELVKKESTKTGNIADGLHLAVRTSLVSPEFLYREIGQGNLSDYELGSRLSYFLTSSPPDEKLVAAIDKGTFFDPEVFQKHAKRFLKSFQRTKFIHDFTSQWLDTEALDTIMPNPKLFRKFNKSHALSMKSEVEMTFANILDNNLSLREFIDPNFIYTSQTIGKEIYQLTKIPKSKNAKLTKVSIKRGTTKGGLLSMPAVMMATANGVDTQPVLRGVWILENILGTPPPEPPKNVPALPPDTAGATDPRDKLAKHMGNASCASCHVDIDPMGFVLESFDPVGRWRTHYPSAKKQKPLKIDSSATMADGTKLNDVRDLKKYLVENPHFFANCLAEKLMEYATGRHLNYREKKLIEKLVDQNIKKGNKMHDLMISLVNSEVFKAR